MKYSEAIAWVKNLNSPDANSNEKEKATAIGTILKLETMNSISKADLKRCLQWLWDKLYDWESEEE